MVSLTRLASGPTLAWVPDGWFGDHHHLPCLARGHGRGCVAYIDPRMDSQSRTAKVRIELADPDGRLKQGMFVDMAFSAQTGGLHLGQG